MEYKRPTLKKPANKRGPMPQYKWSKLKNYPNGSKNIYHSSRQGKIIVHLLPRQTLQQYWNIHGKFPNWERNNNNETNKNRKSTPYTKLAPGARTRRQTMGNSEFKFFFKFPNNNRRTMIFTNKQPIMKKPVKITGHFELAPGARTSNTRNKNFIYVYRWNSYTPRGIKPLIFTNKPLIYVKN
jgi:hypothetical protein